MTKEEARKLLFNTKVYVDGKSEKIQKKLFELGFKWYLDKKVDHTDKPFLYLNEDETLSYGDDMEFYKNNKAREVSVAYILNLKWNQNKEAKENSSYHEEILKILNGLKQNINTILFLKAFDYYMGDSNKESNEETEKSLKEASRIFELIKRDTTDYEWNKRFFERVKKANKKYSLDKKDKVVSMIVDDIDNLINGSNRIISVLYHNHVDTPKSASDLNTFDKCLVCSGKGCVWVPEIYGYKSDDGKHHLIGHSVSSEHVIPYDESLRGKLYNKEDESHEQ